MHYALTYRQHARAVLGLGLPLVGSHLAQFAITLTDAAMLGWYNVESLAAGVLGGEMFFVFFIMGSGFAWAVMPMVASAQGAGEDTQVRRVTRMGLWASILFGCLALPVLLFTEDILRALGQTDEVSRLAGDYNRINGWAIWPALLVMVLKSYLAALERTRVVLWITLLAAGVNALVNYVLIFGNFGAPEMGIRGAAVASVVVHLVSLLALVFYVIRATPEHALFQRLWRPDAEAFGRVFRLGWPIGITNLAEVGLFAASSVMMGWLGTLPLAAHGIALQAASVAFMMHLGLSNAATVRAGHAHGRGDLPGLRAGASVVIGMSTLAALATVILFLVLPEPIISAFMRPDEPDREAVLALGTGLLAAAALFQLVDAGQVIALGLLRGVQDTRVPMVIAAITYWGIGIPASYLLGFTMGLGGVGVWLGLALGLALAAIFMMARFWGWSARLPK
ncbi:MATE family efflux transporter [uncultured Roseovarius sp.]|uniref:MATE family efflux transporter n=1 Tax=uncultured Roseovarius sp. TaxID=293344 RepID=UPI0025D072E7|nr:MATE family efflux transporter [uncultured Roseovarius sp.]